MNPASTSSPIRPTTTSVADPRSSRAARFPAHGSTSSRTTREAGVDRSVMVLDVARTVTDGPMAGYSRGDRHFGDPVARRRCSRGLRAAPLHVPRHSPGSSPRAASRAAARDSSPTRAFPTTTSIPEINSTTTITAPTIASASSSVALPRVGATTCPTPAVRRPSAEHHANARSISPQRSLCASGLEKKLHENSAESDRCHRAYRVFGGRHPVSSCTRLTTSAVM